MGGCARCCLRGCARVVLANRMRESLGVCSWMCAPQFSRARLSLGALMLSASVRSWMSRTAEKRQGRTRDGVAWLEVQGLEGLRCPPPWMKPNSGTGAQAHVPYPPRRPHGRSRAPPPGEACFGCQGIHPSSLAAGALRGEVGEYSPARCHRCQWSPRPLPSLTPGLRDSCQARPGFTSGPSRK